MRGKVSVEGQGGGFEFRVKRVGLSLGLRGGFKFRVDGKSLSLELMGSVKVWVNGLRRCLKCSVRPAAGYAGAVARFAVVDHLCCGNEKGSHLRLKDSCITQLQAQGPSRTCTESEEEEEEDDLV